MLMLIMQFNDLIFVPGIKYFNNENFPIYTKQRDIAQRQS